MSCSSGLQACFGVDVRSDVASSSVHPPFSLDCDKDGPASPFFSIVSKTPADHPEVYRGPVARKPS